MTWKAYGIIPIDFGWHMLPTVKVVAAKLAQEAVEEMLSGPGSGFNDVEKFLRDFGQAKNLAVKEGWEGDYREEPRVFWIPDENEFIYAFAWKQDNNGSTFIVSPRPLPWLNGL